MEKCRLKKAMAKKIGVEMRRYAGPPSHFVVVLPHNIVASGKDFPGARTVLSARRLHWDRNGRTKLSALLWLWLGRAMLRRRIFVLATLEKAGLPSRSSEHLIRDPVSMARLRFAPARQSSSLLRLRRLACRVVARSILFVTLSLWSAFASLRRGSLRPCYA